MNNSTENKENQPVITGKSPLNSNIWGWRFSLISLGIILFFLGLAAYRHWQMGIPFDLKTLMETPMQDTTHTQPERTDSIKIDSLQ